jgi:hypothetical protein
VKISGFYFDEIVTRTAPVGCRHGASERIAPGTGRPMPRV